MKAIKYVLSFLFVLLMTLAAVSAVTLGDDRTEASNIDDDKDSEHDVYRSATLGWSNVSSCSDFVISDTAKYSNDVSTLSSGKYVNLTYKITNGVVDITGRIPESLDSVDTSDSDLKESANEVARLTCQYQNGSSTSTEIVYMQRKRMLELDKIEATWDNDFTSLDDGDDIEDLKPGIQMTLDVIFENLFDDDDDLDIDTEVSIECSPDDIDIDDDSDDQEVSADEKETISFDLDFDEDDVEDENYKCTIKALGEDDFGAMHGEVWEVELKVEKEDYDLEINEFVLSPSQVSCSNKDVTATVRVKNIGKKDDKRVKIEVVSPSLGVSESVESIELDETDSTRKLFVFSIPEDQKAGTYDVIAKAYSLGRSLEAQQIVKITVPDCSPDEPATTTPTTTTPTTTTPTNTDNGNNNVNVNNPFAGQNGGQVVVTPTDDTGAAAEEEEESDNTALYVILLVVLILLLIGGIVGLLIYLFKA
ncbi:hypothetical protein H6503_06010 [Candidatus Woesearchaeota archaeon]|nr:hypothetical protein [Candidatus Woesearchaeota archaeon]